MQGYILRVTKVRDEDCIVSILTQNRLIDSYRFYGARHSSILLGHKIDFELEQNPNFLPRLRGVMHLGFAWLLDRQRELIWQDFIKLLYSHLKDVESLDEGYFIILEEATKKLFKQNPKRVMVESYVKLLELEGRLHKKPICFICDKEVEGAIALARAYLPAHESCIDKKGFKRQDLLYLYKNKSSINLEDEEIELLYLTMLQGL